jgi:hypothetical protein
MIDDCWCFVESWLYVIVFELVFFSPECNYYDSRMLVFCWLIDVELCLAERWVTFEKGLAFGAFFYDCSIILPLVFSFHSIHKYNPNHFFFLGFQAGIVGSGCSVLSRSLRSLVSPFVARSVKPDGLPALASPE